METIYIIDDISKIYAPKTLAPNQQLAEIYQGAKMRKIIITKEENSSRVFGGSFVKIGLRPMNILKWISSTFTADELIQIAWDVNRVEKKDLQII